MKKIIYLVLIFLLVFLLGFFLGNKAKTLQNGSLPASVSQGQPNTFQAGWDAARKKLAESGLIAPLANVEIKDIFGQVAGVKGSQVTLKTTPLDPLADSGSETRIVAVTGNTKIYQLVAKSPEQFQKEMTEFSAKLSKDASQAGLTPPSSSEKKEASLGDIKVGQGVNVVSDKDIKNLKQFEALEIDIQTAQ
jgi:hypothetical protein